MALTHIHSHRHTSSPESAVVLNYHNKRLRLITETETEKVPVMQKKVNKRKHSIRALLSVHKKINHNAKKQSLFS